MNWCGPKKLQFITKRVPQFVFSEICHSHDEKYEEKPGLIEMCKINIRFLIDLFYVSEKWYHYPFAILYFLLVVIFSPIYYIIYSLIKFYDIRRKALMARVKSRSKKN